MPALDGWTPLKTTPAMPPKERTRRMRWHLSVARQWWDEADRLEALAASHRANGREAAAQRAEERVRRALSVATSHLGAAEDLDPRFA